VAPKERECKERDINFATLIVSYYDRTPIDLDDVHIIAGPIKFKYSFLRLIHSPLFRVSATTFSVQSILHKVLIYYDSKPSVDEKDSDYLFILRHVYPEIDILAYDLKLA
jgi:hypothetical protein